MFSPKRYRSHLASLIHSGVSYVSYLFRGSAGASVDAILVPANIWFSTSSYYYPQEIRSASFERRPRNPPGNRFTWPVLFFQFNCIFVAWLDSWAIIILMPTWSSGSRFFNVRLADQCVRVIDQRLFITAPESFELLFACRCGFAAHPEHGSKT